MNKRIVLIDQNETPDYIKYYGWGGLSNENIYTLQNLQEMSQLDRDNILDVSEGDGVMLVGAEPFKFLQSLYHFGIRSENYFDCSKLRRLSIEGGAFVKVITDFPDIATVEQFLDPNFATPKDFSWFQQKILHTYQDAMRFLEWLNSLPSDTHFGFDYEASCMPLLFCYPICLIL